jgi:uracil-DNA glycosylase
MDARNFFPEENTLEAHREASRGCRGCPLWKVGTRTVFGEGRPGARVMFVGEQPGSDEDVKGRPFVGPAGKILERAMGEAGLSRDDAYVTNVVKHFKWAAQGKRRLHRTPNAREIGACLPWLEKEIALIHPEVLVCLGATASKALLGSNFRVSVRRGEDIPSPWAKHTITTVHPSSILRQISSEDRERELRRFIDDLRVVAKLAA